MATITLTWDPIDPSFYVTKYEILGSLNGGMEQVLGETDQETFDLVNLAAGGWYFKVRAYNLAGAGPWSAQVNGPTAPPAVENVVLTVTL